jgi:predicted Zn-dependent protease
MAIATGARLAGEAAQRAVALDPTLAKAHMALAFFHIFLDWNWREAGLRLQRALALAPGDVDAMGIQVTLMSLTGHARKAIPLARKAVELDPLSYFSNSGLLRSLHYSGQYDLAQQQAERMIALNPSGLRSRLFLAFAHLLQGRAEEAVRAAEQVPVEWARNTALACARHAQGRRAESDAALNALKAGDSEHALYQIADVHAYRGEFDAAFEWLEASYRARDTGTTLVKCDPLMQNLRADPRWEAFVRKMGLADDQLA